jgi:hypothetical protein
LPRARARAETSAKTAVPIPPLPPGRDDRDVAPREVGDRLDERARDGLVTQPGDEVGQGVVRLEVEAEVLDLGMRLRGDEAPDVDHRLEIGVGLGRRNRELRELECVHVMSS